MRILVGEAEPELLEVLSVLLRRAGYDVVLARDGAAVLKQYGQQRPDLVLLESELPQHSGWDLCQTIRRNDPTPIILLSETVTDVAVVRGFEAGADDVIGKPFSPRQLLARVQAAVRRALTAPAVPQQNGPALRAGDLVLDPQWRTLQAGDAVVTLTAIESKLLQELLLHEGQVLSHQQLVDRVWGFEAAGDDASLLKGHICNLRRKLAPLGAAEHLRAVVGLGYSFRLDQPVPPAADRAVPAWA